jgi:hypothetical protein
MPPATPNRLLAPKEATLFKELLTLYEARQLKKALKTADHILKKSPRHGGMVYASMRIPRRILLICMATRNTKHEGPCYGAHGQA